jgi:3'-phosphoadenosine 5'-phosphosulfate sulfotransferase (PAPS reductase)/FAD synthetase
MAWRSLQKKQVGESVVHLADRPPQRHMGIIVQRPTADGVWTGVAVFPAAVPQDDRMQHAIAKRRFDELQHETDIEDLIREWGDPEGETLVDFITVSAENDAQSEGLGSYTSDWKSRHEDIRQALKNRASKVSKPKKKLNVVGDVKKIPYSPRNYPKPEDAKDNEVRLLPIEQYDHIVVSFSGGKDSVACVLLLLDMGVPAERIELWHQAVDGEPGVAERFWDWPCTESYCEAFAKAFGFKLLYQWKEGGYLGELYRRDQPTAPSSFQLLDGGKTTVGGTGPLGTRYAFPSMESDLRKRWCSAYVKIDVAKKVFTNDPRFAGTKTLMITGERREESKNRGRYGDVVQYMDPTRDGRVVHQWRAVLSWFELDVWKIMEKYRVRPHPAYYLGWSRVSCLPCIFGDPNQWASVRDVAPAVFARMAKMEVEFGRAAETMPEHTMSEESQRARFSKLGTDAQPKRFAGNLRKGESLPEAADKGTSYVTDIPKETLRLAASEHYNLDVRLGPGERWEMPVGAYRHSGGPT